MGNSFSNYKGFGMTKEVAVKQLISELEKKGYVADYKDYACYDDENYYIYIERYGLYRIKFTKVQSYWRAVPKWVV